MSKLSWAFALLLLVGLPRPALAAPTPAHRKMEQLNIRAQSTEYDGATHTYVLAGDVRISARGLQVTCQKATIYSAPDESQIERIVFQGDVAAHRGKSLFTGTQITLYVPSQRLVAQGDTRTRILIPSLVSPSAAPSSRKAPEAPAP